MRVLRTLKFREFMEEERLPAAAICKAARELSSGLIHARLGDGVYKQRVARAGQGKSGSYRTIVFFRSAGTAFFILGFAKNDRDNLTLRELRALRELAREMLGYGEEAIRRVLADGGLEEVFCEEPVS